MIESWAWRLSEEMVPADFSRWKQGRMWEGPPGSWVNSHITSAIVTWLELGGLMVQKRQGTYAGSHTSALYIQVQLAFPLHPECPEKKATSVVERKENNHGRKWQPGWW